MTCEISLLYFWVRVHFIFVVSSHSHMHAFRQRMNAHGVYWKTNPGFEYRTRLCVLFATAPRQISRQIQPPVVQPMLLIHKTNCPSPQGLAVSTSS